MFDINYTTINHVARKKLGLSWLEYGVADLIYNLANNPQSKVPGWCYASKETIGNVLGISKRGVNKIITRLENLNLIETRKDSLNKSRGNHLRITIDWYKTVIIKGEHEVPTLGVGGNIVPKGGNGVPIDQPQRWEQSSHNKDIYKDNYKDNTALTKTRAVNFCPLKEKHQECITFLDSLAKLKNLPHNWINYPKQLGVLHKLLRLGYAFAEIRNMAEELDRDKFMWDKWDMATVSSRIERKGREVLVDGVDSRIN